MRPPDKRTPAPREGSGGSGNVAGGGSDNGTDHNRSSPVAQHRQRLPNRRPSVVIDLEHDGIGYTASIGLDRHGRPAEIFCRATKPDSAMDLIADDASVVLSIALQYGVPPEQLQHSIGRLHGQPASLIGRLIDLLAEQGGGR